MEEIGRLGVASKDMGSAAQVVVDDGKRVQLAAQSSGFMRGVSGSCGLALPNNEELHCFSQFTPSSSECW